MQTVLDKALSAFPRADLLPGSTPVQRASRLEQHLGLHKQEVKLFIKRDDHMLIGGGGNKLRKLEFHLGAALQDGVDTLITVGGIQSNHARLTAAVCARLGLGCELIFSRAVAKSDADYELNGNMLFDHLFGARVHVLGQGEDSLAQAEIRAAQLRAAGRKPLVIPTGGSTPVGSLGYARCAAEILRQEAELDVQFTEVIVPNGSAGTHAGLAAGFELLGRDTCAARTLQLTRQALALLGSSAALRTDAINIDGSQLGDGYGLPTPAMLEAVRLMASCEGLLVDPVYSGKAFAGLLADLRQGRYHAGDSVLFVMTGGTPGLYAYRDTFVSQ